MSTVPTLVVGGHDQTDYIQHKTLYWKLKSLDFTLVDPVTMPELHHVVSVDAPDWHGRVSTIESHPFKSANGTEHHYVQVTCTNKHTAADDTAPFGISDTPNNTTTFPFKELVYIQTLADQTDLSTAEHRLTATVFREGLLPGQTIPVTCAIEGLSADIFIITEMQVTWIKDDAAVYYIEASVQGLPPPDLGQIIDSQGCDCAPFVPCTADYTVQSFANEDNLTVVFPNHANGQYSTSVIYDGDYMVLYDGATYRIDYLVFHAADSNQLVATLGDVGGSDFGSPGPPYVPGFGTVAPAVYFGDKARHCQFGPPDDIPAASTTFSVSGFAIPGYVNVYAALGELSCVAGDSFASSVSMTATWLSGPDPRFESLTPCEDNLPHSGQRISPESFVGDGSNDTTTLTYPYMPGTIELFVEGVDWTNLITETDPDAGEFSVAYPYPLATDPHANVFVHYRYP